MSDPVAKAERSRAKDARQSPPPEYRPRGGGKKHRPVKVMAKWDGDWAGMRRLSGLPDWFTYGRYRTVREARAALENCQRKHPGFYEFKIVEAE